MTLNNRSIRRRLLPVLAMTVLLLSGCGPSTAAPSAAPAADTPVPTAEISPTPEPPTATPAPLAARVNGQGILLGRFEAELARYQAAHPNDSATVEAQRGTVLDDMIREALLAQAAAEAGFEMDDEALQKRINAVADQAGGMPALQDWMNRNGYTDADFREALRSAAAAAWQRDQISSSVPQAAEQIHARQILLRDVGEAENLLAQVQNGADFATLAYRYDPVTGGELGWFPRGYLTQPEVEEAVFALQPGETSAVIQSSIGYHIVNVIEREAQRPLGPEARRALQEKALREWLEQKIAASSIERLIQ